MKTIEDDVVSFLVLLPCYICESLASDFVDFMVVILVSACYYYFFSLPFAEARRRNNNSLNFMSYVVWFMGNINSISIKPVVVLGSTEWRFFFPLILHE